MDRVGPSLASRSARSVRLWVAAGVAVCVLVALGLWWLPGRGPTPITRADVDRAVAAGVQHAQQQQLQAPPDAAVAYRTILPSLVTVTTDAAPAQASKAPSTSAGGSLGAGVVVNDDGSVLTALHVVAGGGVIHVHFADGTQSVARVTQQQAASDVAVLSLDTLPGVIVPAVLGGGPQVGDAVFPVGNPLGLTGTLSAGVVSGLDRSIRTESGGTLTGLIQFDAAVNPGNSGGPLLNRAGQVIGIVTGLANPSQQPFFVGIGFAVPIATAGGVAGGPAQ